MTVNLVNNHKSPLQELENIRHSSIIGLTEAHRYMASMQKDTYCITALCNMMDSAIGDKVSTDFITKNSKTTFADKQATDLKNVFSRLPLDLSHIDTVIYSAIDALEDLLGSLVGWLNIGSENLKKVIIVLNGLVETLKKMVLDTMLKIFIHNRIEMLIKAPTNTRVA
jgi:hypothetical protein